MYTAHARALSLDLIRPGPYTLRCLAIQILLCLHFLAALSAAQTVVEGTVRDSSGAAIQGAKVNLYHQHRTAPQSAFTASDGTFSFSAVAAGGYQLTAEAPGFYPS